MADWPEDQLRAEFSKVTAKTINEQATFFLRSFVSDFFGNFDEVLDLAEEFKKYAPKVGDVRELEEDAAHLFLEKRGETMTIVELRDALRAIDLDMNKKVSFIEYCLYKYKKTIRQLFEEKTGDIAALLKKLEEAIEAHQKVMELQQAREDEMKQLEEEFNQGGVKGMKAKIKLEMLKNEDELARNRRTVEAEAKKRAAQRAVDNGDPYVEEQKRLAEEKKKKEAEEKAEKQAARDRLKAKAAAFHNP